ncbi:phosphate ABC transporter permease subunit PstC [Pseudomonas aeruginosa]|uniref:phosphate ABC transporter permease subunit PstC n=1 Tax=Pseudomonas aeruginosa TaxID=287 RepID=UPI003CC6B8D3
MLSNTPLSLRQGADRVLQASSLACALSAAAVLLLVLAFLTQASWPMLQHAGDLLDSTWRPARGQFGLQTMLGASLLSSLLALLLAVPTGLLVNVWLIFYAPTVVAKGYAAMLGLMASIPSVVYGLWGLVVLVPLLNDWVPPGASLLAAGIVLGLMILPLLMVQADVALRESAHRHLSAALCLGVSRWAAIRGVVLRAAWPRLWPSILLQLGRALGETMAVLMVAGNVVQWPGSIFDPVRTLTANIALEMSYATGPHLQALYVSGWLLLVMALLLMGLARIYGRRS